MKKSLLFLMLTLALSACRDTCWQTRTYTKQVPIWISKADLNAQNGKWLPQQIMQQTGKIFVFGKYVLISEPNKGIHFVDNTNPRQPKNIGFLQVYGNLDIAVKNNLLYVDSFQDLLCFDLSNIQKPKKIFTQKNVFKQRYIQENRAKDSIVVAFESKQITEKIKCSESFSPINNNIALSNGFPSNAAPSSPNKAGSMAAFLVVNDYLYTVETSKLHIFNLAGAQPAQLLKSVDLNWGVETIFASEDKLFLGTMNGMRIFSIQNPQNPAYLGNYEHPIACDPVVVKGNYAFVTTRSGTTCFNGRNQLDVVDISNPRLPKLVKSYPMLHPHGLAIENKKLLVCEGKFGFKQFDASDTHNLVENVFIRNVDSFDIITLPKSFLVIGQDGLYQYNYDFALLSKIATR